MKKYDACGRLATMEIFSHGESEARSDLSTNPRESTRTGIRENPCPSVANTSPRFYTHDGNKNVSEAVAADAATNEAVEVVAHYDYAAFGAVVAQKGDCAEANPWRFSGEYEDTELGLVYYNYRHYEPVTGRWMARDPSKMDDRDLSGLYVYVANDSINWVDLLGEKRNPGNRRLIVRPKKPRLPPIDVVPTGPSVPSDGSLADAFASLLSMVHGSRMAAEIAGEEACKRISPSKPPNSCPMGRPALEAGMGRCCRVSILKQMMGEYEVYTLEKVSVDNMPCDEARGQSGLWAHYPGVERILHDRPWR